MTSKVHQDVIDVIQKELDKRGMSQRQLALKAGVKPESLNRVLTGKSVPTVSYLGKIATAFDKRLQLRFGGKKV